MNKGTKIIFLFFIGISLIICITGIYSLYINLHKNEACTEKVEAVCYDMEVMHHRDGKRYYKTYTPCFKYEFQGSGYEKSYGIHYPESRKDTFKVGETYTIYVNPKAPHQMYVEGHEEDIDTFAFAGPLVGGVNALLFTVLYFIVKRRLEKKENS